MTSRWEKPGFEVLRVAGECTAYSGAGGVMHRPAAEAGMAEGSARSGNPPIDRGRSGVIAAVAG
jgi:hypothetical protein